MRSLLFLPSTRLDRVERAHSSGADFIVLDLEDSLLPEARAQARTQLDALAARAFDGLGSKLYLRINSLDSRDGIFDLAAWLTWTHKPHGVMIPKVESPAQIAWAQSLLGPSIAIIASLETPSAIANAPHMIADIKSAATQSLAGFVLGSLDYGRMFALSDPDSRPPPACLQSARIAVATLAAGSRVAAIDGAWPHIQDKEGLIRDVSQARQAGLTAKLAIHPSQISAIHQGFQPSADRISWAKRLLAHAKGEDAGAFMFEGTMVDAPVLARARSYASIDSIDDHETMKE
ncbi:MAG: CoA ester lyase [Pseudomonadota bacterium]